MKRILSILACVCICGCATPLKKMEGVSAGDILYARSNLMVKGDTIFWHNMSGFKNMIPAGTEIDVSNFSRKAIVFSIPGKNKKYRLLAETGNYDKYFVKNKQDIGLEKISSDIMEKIKLKEISKGMTKDEVYISKGCPAYIAWGKESLRNSLKDIMSSDTWYYHKNSRVHDCSVQFKDGIVDSIGKY